MSVGLIPAAEGVEITVVVNWGGEMNLEGCAAPDWFERFVAGQNLQENRADSIIGGGEKNRIIHDNGTHGIDGIVGTRTEPITKINGAIGGIHGDEALAGEAEKFPLTIYGGGDRGGGAGLFIEAKDLPIDFAFAGPGNHGLTLPIFFADIFPNSLTGFGIKGDDAGIWLAANHNDKEVAFEKGSAADTEKCFGNLPVFASITFPD